MLGGYSLPLAGTIVLTALTVQAAPAFKASQFASFSGWVISECTSCIYYISPDAFMWVQMGLSEWSRKLLSLWFKFCMYLGDWLVCFMDLGWCYSIKSSQVLRWMSVKEHVMPSQDASVILLSDLTRVQLHEKERQMTEPATLKRL